jgi:DNA-binding NarL/FixJ family response regulator
LKIVLLDHELYRMGIRLILNAVPGYEIVGEAGTERDALNVVATAAPDVVIMDTVLPGLQGAEGVKAILGRAPGARVLILTDDRRITAAADAMTAGAAGYALKGDSNAEFGRAVERVQTGRTYVAPALTSRLLARLRRRAQSDQPAPYVG